MNKQRVNATDIILSIPKCNIQLRECTSRAHRFKVWSERLSRDSVSKLQQRLLSDDGEMELTACADAYMDNVSVNENRN